MGERAIRVMLADDHAVVRMGFRLLLLMFAAVTLGGLGTAYGALLGSLVIGLVVEMSTLIPGMPSDLRYASALVILILVLLFRPQGLLGTI